MCPLNTHTHTYGTGPLFLFFQAPRARRRGQRRRRTTPGQGRQERARPGPCLVFRPPRLLLPHPAALPPLLGRPASLFIHLYSRVCVCKIWNSSSLLSVSGLVEGGYRSSRRRRSRLLKPNNEQRPLPWTTQSPTKSALGECELHNASNELTARRQKRSPQLLPPPSQASVVGRSHLFPPAREDAKSDARALASDHHRARAATESARPGQRDSPLRKEGGREEHPKQVVGSVVVGKAILRSFPYCRDRRSSGAPGREPPQYHSTASQTCPRLGARRAQSLSQNSKTWKESRAAKAATRRRRRPTSRSFSSPRRLLLLLLLLARRQRTCSSSSGFRACLSFPTNVHQSRQRPCSILPQQKPSRRPSAAAATACCAAFSRAAAPAQQTSCGRTATARAAAAAAQTRVRRRRPPRLPRSWPCLRGPCARRWLSCPRHWRP